MSLIDEALKRARLDAARQEAMRQDAQGAGPRLWVPTHLPPAPETRRSRRLRIAVAAAGGLLAGVLIVALVARSGGGAARGPARTGQAADLGRPPAAEAVSRSAGGAGEAWESASRRPRRELSGVVDQRSQASARPRPERGERRAPAASSLPRSPKSGSRAGSPAPGSSAASASTNPAAGATGGTAAGGSSAASASAVYSPAGAAGAADAPGAASTAAAGRSAGSPEPAPEDGRTYVREAKLPGGAKLSLGGIAYSETQPAAVINGQVVGPGQVIGDFTVVRIESQRVELRGRGMTLYLGLK